MSENQIPIKKIRPFSQRSRAGKTSEVFEEVPLATYTVGEIMAAFSINATDQQQDSGNVLTVNVLRNTSGYSSNAIGDFSVYLYEEPGVAQFNAGDKLSDGGIPIDPTTQLPFGIVNFKKENFYQYVNFGADDKILLHKVENFRPVAFETQRSSRQIFALLVADEEMTFSAGVENFGIQLSLAH